MTKYLSARSPLKVYDAVAYGAVGDGTTDDTTAIQAALTAAASAGGGTVYLQQATYVVSNLTIDSYVTLQGAGRGTLLQGKSGATGYMIALTTPSTSQRTTIRDLALQPNTGTLGGIKLDNTGFGTSIDPIHAVEKVVVLNAGGDAFHFDNSMRELRVEGCYAHYSGGYGFYVGAGCTDSRFIADTVGPSTSHGFYILGNNNNFVACKSFYAGFNGSTWGTTQSGFYLSSAAYCTFTSCSSQQSALHGFYLSGMTYSTVVACDADTNSAGTTGGVGFYTSYCTHSSLIGNTGNINGILSPGAQAYGIAVDGTQTSLMLYGNTVTGSSGEFQYVSGGGYMLISGSIADFSGIGIKINDVLTFALAGATSGTTTISPAAVASGTWTLPATTDTFVGRATSDTLTNKILTAPTISTISNSGTLTLPTGSDTLLGRATTDTVTNKRITERVSSTTSSATPSVSTDTFDQLDLTAQAAAITSFTLSGTPTDGQDFIIRIKATGAFAITAPTNVSNSGIASFPTTTVSSKTITVGLRYDSTAAKWIVLAADNTGY